MCGDGAWSRACPLPLECAEPVRAKAAYRFRACVVGDMRICVARQVLVLSPAALMDVRCSTTRETALMPPLHCQHFLRGCAAEVAPRTSAPITRAPFSGSKARRRVGRRGYNVSRWQGRTSCRYLDRAHLHETSCFGVRRTMASGNRAPWAGGPAR